MVSTLACITNTPHSFLFTDALAQGLAQDLVLGDRRLEFLQVERLEIGDILKSRRRISLFRQRGHRRCQRLDPLKKRRVGRIDHRRALTRTITKEQTGPFARKSA